MSEDKTQGSTGADTNEEKRALYESADGGLPSYPDSEMDSSKVKFINGGTADPVGDAKVEMGATGKDQEFVGLTKEELMKYADDPYWVRVRWILLILFWVAWFAMLAAAIIIIVVAPRCPHRPNLMWWQKDVMYQVYPRSFKDSYGDGTGDLKGIREKLDYVKKTVKANSIWLNPIYESPGKDLGYDISDFKAIDPLFGTMADFDDLRLEMHNKGMHLIMDFVPNHSSKDHPWFQASRNNKSDDNPYRDYYVWADGKNGDPPNNWLSVFGGSAWTLDPKRNQYYLHQFLPDQPDLNVRNEKVREELEDILRFWLDKGVDGFKIDALAHLFEVNDTNLDEPKNPDGAGVASDDYDYLAHNYTTFQPKTYEITTRWRAILDEYYSSTDKYRFMVAEVYGTPEQVMKFYKYNGKKGADMPFNMGLTKLKKGCGGKCVRDLVNNWMSTMPNDQWANWVLGNHDQSRVATRLGENYVNAANMMALLLPGTATTYYGEEIGMVDGFIEWSDTQDPVGKKFGRNGFQEHTRDPERTPMQWNTKNYAGFTDGNGPWLPVNADYKTKNVKVELAHGAGVTSLEVYQEASALRKEPSFSWGSYKEAVVNENIFSFVRSADGFPGFLVAFNLGTSPAVIDFHGAHKNMIPDKGTIVANTANFEHHARSSDFEKNQVVTLSNILLKPGEGVVFKWAANALDE